MHLNQFCRVCLCWILLAAFTCQAQSTQTTSSEKKSKVKTKTVATANAKASNAAPVAPSPNSNKSSSKTAKKPRGVRVTVTRNAAPAVEARPSFATALGLRGQRDELSLKSSVAIVVNQNTKEVYFEKNSSVSLPIASITKLMTAMVVLDSQQPLDENLTINAEDAYIYKHSRLAEGTVLSREDALHLALMSSENRAAYTLGRHYPGGIPAFVDAMNRKAKEIGMDHSHYADPTGLLSENVSSAEDLVRMLNAAYQYKMIREFSTWPDLTMVIRNRPQKFLNTNRLVRSGDMDIGLQKTGFINAAGKCLVMQARVNNTPLLLVFLDSVGTQSRFADAVRVRDWYSHIPPGEVQPIRRLM